MDTGGNSLPSPSCPDATKRRVCYYYDGGIANVDFGGDHVMVPRRVDMAHALVRSYGLLDHMTRLRTRPATEHEIAAFHEPGYVGFLRDLTPEGFNAAGGEMTTTAQKYKIGYDNPAIAGLWDYCRRYAGGSLAAARALASRDADVAINWSGGMHHARRGNASGFCFVNDIVLAVNELLGHFGRVLYVDIDVHHGDGVEAAFIDSNRVMTVSFHQRTTHGFFPAGKGNLRDVGEGQGELHAVNVPMYKGMDDEGYHLLFKPIMEKAMGVFQPEAIVMQCGGDSLSGDRLGRLNLSVAGHAQCVSYMRSFNVPLLLLGGGGYTINHVAACWCYETAVAVGKEKEIDDHIPVHCYDGYYSSQDYKLHYPVDKKRKNENTSIYIRDTATAVIRNLSAIKGEPIMQLENPRGGSAHTESLFHSSPPSEDDDPMERLHRRCGRMDKRCFFVELGKRQHKLKLAEEDIENGGSHQTSSQSEPVPVKRNRHEY